MKKFLVTIMILILCGCEIEIKHNDYEYIDTFGNKGIAKECEHNIVSMYCKLEDDTIIKIVSYKEIK